jgi:hypothetical protein
MKYYTTVIGSNGCSNKHFTTRNSTLTIISLRSSYKITNLKGTDKLGDLGVDGKVNTKMDLKEISY